MTDDRHTELEAALESVIAAARVHLEAVKAADGRPDDDAVWSAYVALNNAAVAYDDEMLSSFGEVTPWDVQPIDPDAADVEFASVTVDRDAEPTLIAVRQRRDYLVPNAAALMRVAQKLRTEADDDTEVANIGEAVLELLQAGDGSLAPLDIPELEPLDGVVTVSEVDSSLDPDAAPEDDIDAVFAVGAGEKLVGRFDEHPFDDEGVEED
ncbi:hypothetical protein Lfu02_36240 [Longispora fulva]|uniref:Uncharacterized protein n=1 Tax=Longispora fulva TaxID=619741 RepID=A0A8J7GPN4_9ACTN|nr:hypothetical protein [Longispora fulva]MBG6141595.1 hypothetical protein [Longispora fulva]GIG59252.1 hypothetical protein Lfu02_36240 [Longispora fulva]